MIAWFEARRGELSGLRTRTNHVVTDYSRAPFMAVYYPATVLRSLDGAAA